MKKQKRLPTYLTTVTPLSKAIALSMFIIFPIIAFYLGLVYQKGISPGYCSP